MILLTTKEVLEDRFLLLSVTTKEEAVKVERFKLPTLSMLTRLEPLLFWKEARAESWLELALTTKMGVVEATE